MRTIALARVPSRARAHVLISVVGTATWLASATPAAQPYKDPSLPVATRVEDLLGRMTLDDKLGQMTQAERASIIGAQITQYRIGSVLSGCG